LKENHLEMGDVSAMTRNSPKLRRLKVVFLRFVYCLIHSNDDYFVLIPPRR